MMECIEQFGALCLIFFFILQAEGWEVIDKYIPQLDAVFADALSSEEQELEMSGVGAHHQNGVAERAIQTVTKRARAMMQHSFLHWPEEFQVKL